MVATHASFVEFDASIKVLKDSAPEILLNCKQHSKVLQKEQPLLS